MSMKPRQREKLLAILNLLLKESDEQHPLSAALIAELLEQQGIPCERKAVYDNVETLQKMGYDVVLQKGRGGGYYLGERDFQLAELKLLVDAVQASKFITAQKSRELIEKLSAQASRHQAASLQRQVYVAGKTKTENERIYYTIDSIHEAIAEDHKLSFRYFDYDINRNKVYRHGGERYLVSPFAMIWDDENYYLLAYSDKDEELRHYRVDKMEALTLLEENRSGRSAFRGEDLTAYTDRRFGMFHGEEEEITLLCENWMARVLIDRFGDEVTMIPCDKDLFLAKMRVVVSDPFYGWLFGLGGAAVVLRPESVRKGMKRRLNEMIRKYRASYDVVLPDDMEL